MKKLFTLTIMLITLAMNAGLCSCKQPSLDVAFSKVRSAWHRECLTVQMVVCNFTMKSVHGGGHCWNPFKNIVVKTSLPEV